MFAVVIARCHTNCRLPRNACKFYCIVVSSHFGFGLMDANKMVQYGKNWTSVPEQVTCEVYLKTSGLVIVTCFSYPVFRKPTRLQNHFTSYGSCLFESSLMPVPEIKHKFLRFYCCLYAPPPRKFC